MSLEEVKAVWPAFIDKVKEANRSLGVTLKTVTPVAVTDGRLVLACGYRFHQEMLEIKKNWELMTTALSELVGTNLPVTSRFDPAMKKTNGVVPAKPEANAAAVLEAFGGEVVE